MKSIWKALTIALLGTYLFYGFIKKKTHFGTYSDIRNPWLFRSPLTEPWQGDWPQGVSVTCQGKNVKKKKKYLNKYSENN